MNKKVIVSLGVALASLPALAFAQTTIQSVLGIIVNILNTVIPIVITLGIIYFIWGVVSFVIAGDEEAKTKGRDRMIYGIIGLVVIVGMWGIIEIVKRTFNLDNGVPPVVDIIPTFR